MPNSKKWNFWPWAYYDHGTNYRYDNDVENGAQISSWKGSLSRPKIGVEQLEE